MKREKFEPYSSKKLDDILKNMTSEELNAVKKIINEQWDRIKIINKNVVNNKE